jgi:hypothetical protein
MARERRIVSKLLKAVDRALMAGVELDRDKWCLIWSRALKPVLLGP